MAYAHCIPARIATLTHTRDNIVTGTVEIAGSTIGFRTRGHIVKATNRVYRKAPWKPAANDLVLIDGDLGRDLLVVDHVEPDLSADGTTVEHRLLDNLSVLLPKTGPATKTLRLWRQGRPTDAYRLRWVASIKPSPRLKTETGALLHAEYRPGADSWRVWATDADTGALVYTGLPHGFENLLEDGVSRAPTNVDTASPAAEAVPQPAPASAEELEDCPF